MSHVHLGELAIARLLLGGAEPPADVADCPDCRVAIGQARGEVASFVRVIGPRTLPAIEGRLARRRLVRFTAAGLAVVTAAALLWLANRPATGAATRLPVIAAKGGPTLHVMVRHGTGSGDHVFDAENGAHLVPGDAIRFVLDTEGGHYVLVLSVDSAGQINVYHPYGGDASAPIDTAARRVVLDGSIVLDDAPGPERIWAVISDRPISVATLRVQLAAIRAGGASAIRLGADLMLPDARQASMWFEKPAAPASLERTP